MVLEVVVGRERSLGWFFVFVFLFREEILI